MGVRRKDQPRCIIITGPNGAGKTTFARKLLSNDLGIKHFVNADLIAAGLSPLHPELAAMAAGRLLLQEVERLMGLKVSFALESTLSGRSYLITLERLKELGYRVEIVFLKLESPELAIKRVAHRVKHGGHHVPAADVHRRFKRGWLNFVMYYSAQADSWAVYENSGSTPILLDQKS